MAEKQKKNLWELSHRAAPSGIRDAESVSWLCIKTVNTGPWVRHGSHSMCHMRHSTDQRSLAKPEPTCPGLQELEECFNCDREIHRFRLNLRQNYYRAIILIYFTDKIYLVPLPSILPSPPATYTLRIFTRDDFRAPVWNRMYTKQTDVPVKETETMQVMK